MSRDRSLKRIVDLSHHLAAAIDVTRDDTRDDAVSIVQAVDCIGRSPSPLPPGLPARSVAERPQRMKVAKRPLKKMHFVFTGLLLFGLAWKELIIRLYRQALILPIIRADCLTLYAGSPGYEHSGPM